jgi:hypothetical protein
MGLLLVVAALVLLLLVVLPLLAPASTKVLMMLFLLAISSFASPFASLGLQSLLETPIRHWQLVCLLAA